MTAVPVTLLIGYESPLVQGADLLPGADNLWMDQASCAQTDPESFFPDTGERPDLARRVCARCPVQAECLRYALDHRIDYGVWGGWTERARRRYRLTSRSQ